MNRNQELLNKLMTSLDLEFKNATGAEEDGWYVWRNSKTWPVAEYQVVEIADGEMYETDSPIDRVDCCKPYGQLAGPILGR